MTSQEFREKATTLIDGIKAVTTTYGLGNHGKEFDIITQVFLYKFLNDKFAHEVKRIEPKLAKAKSWEDELRQMPADDFDMLLLQLSAPRQVLRFAPGSVGLRPTLCVVCLLW